MIASLMRELCIFGMRQQRSVDHLKKHLVYIDALLKEAREHSVLFSSQMDAPVKTKTGLLLPLCLS